MGSYDKDAHLRSILKAISYRVLAAVATGSIAFAFTRRWDLSVGIAMVEAVVKICCYYVHERAWSYIGFGKKKHPLSSLPVDRPLKDGDMEEIKKKLKELGYISEE